MKRQLFIKKYKNSRNQENSNVFTSIADSLKLLDSTNSKEKKEAISTILKLLSKQQYPIRNNATFVDYVICFYFIEYTRCF